MYSVRNGKVTQNGAGLTTRILALTLNRNDEILDSLKSQPIAKQKYQLKKDRNGHHVFGPTGPLRLQEICEILNTQIEEIASLRLAMTQNISFSIVRKSD